METSKSKMPPPPRRVKPTVVLKNIHAEQISKLQAKHQQECDLLEDIRTFARQRSIIEKEYAQSLLKLTGQLLRKEVSPPPDLTSEDGQEHKTALTVWRIILEETEKVAKARIQASDQYMERVAEPAKPLRSSKMQCLKKVSAQLTAIQSEVAQSIMEMSKAHKVYNIDEGLAHDARQKAVEAEDRLKRKPTGLFQSRTSLQKNCAKLHSRSDACEVKATLSRNDYLLSLAAANAHSIRYYSTDLPELITNLDGEVYEKMKDFFMLLGKTAADISSAEKEWFDNVVVQGEKVSRQYNKQCFLYNNRVFTDLVQYRYEPCHGDTCNKVSGDHNASVTLDKEARKWATKIAKENKIMRDTNRSMRSLNGHTAGEKKSSDQSSQDTAAEPELKMEEYKQNIRKSETAKLKAEARIEALREAGVNVEEWLASAQIDTLGSEEDDMQRTPSQVSLRTESSGGASNEDHEATYTHYDDDDDFIDDAFTDSTRNNIFSVSSVGQQLPIKCKALYDFQATNDDELTMKENDDIEIIAEGDGDGWVRAKNTDGVVGYIPENYVNMGDTVAPDNVSNMSDPVQQQQPVESQPVPPPEPIHEVTSSYSSGDLEVQQTTNEMKVDHFQMPTDDGAWAKALYDYEAAGDEELSFTEGTLIKILRKDENGVDDGFWEGEINGHIGVFPSLVVEELETPSSTQVIVSPVIEGPPEFFPPPPVTVTLPTPDADTMMIPVLNGSASPVSDQAPDLTTDQIYSKRVHFSNEINHLKSNGHPVIIVSDDFGNDGHPVIIVSDDLGNDGHPVIIVSDDLGNDIEEEEEGEESLV